MVRHDASRTPAALLAVALFAGCVAGPASDVLPDVPQVRVEPEIVKFLNTTVAGATLIARSSSGGGSSITLQDGAEQARLDFERGVLVFKDKAPSESARVTIKRGENADFLIPPGRSQTNVTVTLNGVTETLTLDAPYAGKFSLVSGLAAIREAEVLRDEYPHRTPGMPNYIMSQGHFAKILTDLGYDVEVDPYGTNDYESAGVPVRNLRPNDFANVVAIKHGTMSPEKYVIVGAHYDVVANTIEGFTDNTAGTLEILELARALQPVKTKYSVVFGLWGGEEVGLLGSQFFARSNPAIIANTLWHVNLDDSVTGYPGPAGDPRPVYVSSGPDGPAGDYLSRFFNEIRHHYMMYPEEAYVYATVGKGQAGDRIPGNTGTGSDAQSDHTSFISAGVPSSFIFSGDEYAFHVLHRPIDTLKNATAHMAGIDDENAVLGPEEEALGRDLLGRSFETHMWPVFYAVMLTELGHFDVTEALEECEGRCDTGPNL